MHPPTSFLGSLLGLSYILIQITFALHCTTIPEDSTWPSQTIWNKFNKSVDGRLIKSIPLASACHGAQFRKSECTKVRQNWHTPEFHEASSSSIMSASFANRSCDPYHLEDRCTIGTYVVYSVNVSTPLHVIKAVKFSKAQNIRFVVRNTGHDYMGKSTGHGGLAVWMHHLTETEWFTTFKSKGYRGPAVKMHAGVSNLQMFEEASARGFSIIGGDCPSVGMAGGFIQGGGVGPLSSINGLLADQALAYEIVTATGHFVTATPTHNADLYWAMSGGGPGTYGILWSVTVKVQPDVPISAATLTFSTSSTVSLDAWWKGVDAYRAMVFPLVAAGGYSLAVYTSGSFQMTPAILPNKSLEELDMILEPFITELKDNKIPFNISRTRFPGFLQAHTTLLPSGSPLFEVQNTVLGSRLLHKSLWKSPSTLARLNKAVREIVDDGAGAYDISVSPSVKTDVHNSVFPSWRDTQTELAILLPWNDTGTLSQAQEQQYRMTNVYMQSLKKLSPGTGAYLNEADAFDPEWKETFYGSNYQKLLAIKDVWDPQQLLYGSTAVGGDRWTLQNDGRLCQVK